MGLIERLLEKVLSDYAGEFLKVNREQLAASLMRGEVVLSGVELRVDGLKEMMKTLPFSIKSAVVKSLKLKIPWNELKSKSVRVHVSGIEIVITPQKIDDGAAGDSWADVLKRQRLLAAETLLTQMMEGEAEREVRKESESNPLQTQQVEEEEEEYDVEDTQQSSSTASLNAKKKSSRMSLVQRVVARIIDNLSITIEGLHVRYEDERFKLGLRIEELLLFTVAEQADTQAFVDRTKRPTPAFLKRRLKVKGFSVYHEIRNQNQRKDMIKPFGIGVTLTQHLISAPTYLFSLEAKTEGKIVVVFGPDQSTDLAAVVERATAHDEFVTNSAILKFRPNQTPKEDPLGWWRFAIRAIQTTLRQDKNEDNQVVKNTWPRIIQLIRQRWKYVLLYKRKLIHADSKFQTRARKHSKVNEREDSRGGVMTMKGEDLNPSLLKLGSMAMKGEAESLEEEHAANSLLKELEIELPFRSIMLFRAFAEAEFREEKLRLKKYHRSKKIPYMALSAVVHGATTGRKLLMKSLSRKKPASSTTSAATAATIVQNESIVDDSANWALDAIERQELYESVACDPATSWMIERSMMPSSTKRFGFGVSFEVIATVPMTILQLNSNNIDPIMEIKLGEAKVKFENAGLIIGKVKNQTLWNAAFTLMSADFIDLRPELQTLRGDHRDIPGSLKTSISPAQNAPLIQMQVEMSLLREDHSKMKVMGEIRPTQLVVSLDLIEKLISVLFRVHVEAPTTIGRLRELRERARAGVSKQSFQVRIDWETPVISIPVSMSKEGAGMALAFDLGFFRVRSLMDDTQLNFESHGMKSSMSMLEKHSGGWNLVIRDDDDKLFEKLNLDLFYKIDNNNLDIELTPILLRVDEKYLGAMAGLFEDVIGFIDNLSGYVPTPSSSFTVPTTNFPALSVKLPKIEMDLACPRSQSELRVRRSKWGYKGDDDYSLLPETGYLKFRLEQLHVSFSKNLEGTIKIDQISLRDELQQGGEQYSDLLRIQQMSVHVKSKQILIDLGENDVICNWNPSTVDSLLFFAKARVNEIFLKSRDHLKKKPFIKLQQPKPQKVIPFDILFQMKKSLYFKLNQETIGSRVGYVRIDNLRLKLVESGSKAQIQVQKFYMVGTQWEPLASLNGDQLVGPASPESKEDFVDAIIDINSQAIQFQGRNLQFLWAHTLTKQFADYVTDGIMQVVTRYFSSPLKEDENLIVGKSPAPKPIMNITGTFRNCVVLAPAMRFGERYHFSKTKTDHFRVVVPYVGAQITVFDPKQRRSCVNGLFREDDAGGCGKDARVSASSLGAQSDGLVIQDPAVEIRLRYQDVSVSSFRGDTAESNLIGKGVSGLLTWRIVEFTREQKLVRKLCKPLTARERARLDQDISQFGEFGIPYGEHPHGVNSTKFEMTVDVESGAHFEFTPRDFHLMFLVIFENIADHRRRLARVRPPKLPLFEDSTEVLDDLIVGPDELVNGDFGKVSKGTYDLVPNSMSEEQVAHDVDGFSGDNTPAIIDLDLSLHFPDFSVTFVSNKQSPLCNFNVLNFEMALSEFYDRSQFVEISMDRVTMFSDKVMLLDVRPSNSIYKNPSNLRVRQMISRDDHKTEWRYLKVSKPVYVTVTKFPQKDKRVEIGLEKVELNLEMDFVKKIIRLEPELQITDGADRARLLLPGSPNGPQRVRRSLALELFCNRFGIHLRVPENPDQIILKGSARVIVVNDRSGSVRAQIEVYSGISLKALTDEESISLDDTLLEDDDDNEEEAEAQEKSYNRAFRSWLEGIYERRNPIKLAEVDSILRAFSGNEQELIQNICQKYKEEPFDFKTFTEKPRVVQARSLKPKTRGPSDSVSKKYSHVTIVDPFGLRLDFISTSKDSQYSLIVEPVQGRLTNGHLEAIRKIMISIFDQPPRPPEMKGALTPSSSKSFKCHFHGIEFDLINDYGSYSFPLLRARISGLAFSANQTDQLFSASCQILAAVRTKFLNEIGLPIICIDYFNPRLLEWEPLLEPWEFEATFEKKPGVHILFRARRPINLNCTYSFVESFAYWLACRSARSRGKLVSGSAHSEHYIVNDTGMPVTFWAEGSQELSRTLLVGQRAPLKFTSRNRILSSSSRQKHDFYKDPREGIRVGEDEHSAPAIKHFASPTFSTPTSRSVLVNFVFGELESEFARLSKVPINAFGTLVYGLNKPAAKVTIHVSLEHGSKVVRVLSPVQFRNETSRELLLLLTTKEQKHIALGPIPADKSTFPIPLDCLASEFQYRPVTPRDKQTITSTIDKSRTELEAEGAGAVSNTSDEQGYAWGTSISLLKLHTLVDRPVAITCIRSKSYTKNEVNNSFFEQKNLGGGAAYRFASFVGVESFESSDELGLRETYVVTIAPLIKMQNRLPCPLLFRSIKREIIINAGEPGDIPISGGRILMGEDVDLHHVILKSNQNDESVPDELVPTYEISKDVWLNVSLPGFSWSIPFQPTLSVTPTSVVVTHQSGYSVRLMLECQEYAAGNMRVAVFVESWLINDVKPMVGLAYQESGVAGEQLIFGMGSKFKDRGGQIMKAIMPNRLLSPTSNSSTPPRKFEEDVDDVEFALFSEGRNLSVRLTLLNNVVSQWSNSLNLDNIGAHSDVLCDLELEKKNSFTGLLGMSIATAPNIYRRSRIVTFCPRIVFVNACANDQEETVLFFSSLKTPPVRFDEVVPGTCLVEKMEYMFLFDSTSLLEDESEENPTDEKKEDREEHEKVSTNRRIFPILRLAMKRKNEWWGWSGPFRCIESDGEFSLKLKNTNSGEVCVMRVKFEEHEASTVLFVEKESLKFPLYRVLSQTEEPIHYFQPFPGSKRGTVERLFKGNSRPFGWDEPSLPNRMIRIGFRGDSSFFDVKIDEISPPAVVHLPSSRNRPGKTVFISVRIRGITKTLLITDRPPVQRIRQRIATTQASEVQIGSNSSESEDENNQIMFSFRMEIGQFGLSFVDRAPQELLYVSLTDVLVEYTKTKNTQAHRLNDVEEDDDEGDDLDDGLFRRRRASQQMVTGGIQAFDLSIGRLQCDNQLTDAQFPILLGPASSWTRLDESVRPTVLRCSLVKRFGENSEFDFIEFASFQMYEMDLKVEDSFLLLFGRMAWECAMSLRSEEELVSGKVDSDVEGAYSRLKRWMAPTPSEVRKTPTKFSIKSWLDNRPTKNLQTITSGFLMNDGGRKDPKELLSLARFRTASAKRGDETSGIGVPASFDAEYVAKSLPPALINIDNAKLRLLPLIAPHVLAERRTLFKAIARHYSRQALTQVYRILGSSDLMGNPLGVVSDLTKGLNDFIAIPFQGIARASPSEFIKGLGRGTFSLLRHVTLGTFDALSKVSGALGAGVALLSLDHRFVANRWTALRFEQPRTVGNGLMLGMRAFATSIYDVAGGVIVRPLRSVAEEGSAQAFARELGLGLVGIFVKPVVGVLDFTSRASNGVIASVQSFDPETTWLRVISRVRLPRAFTGSERRLGVYLHEDAFVSHLIKRLELYIGNENLDYQAHVRLDGNFLLVCAGQRLWCVDSTSVLNDILGKSPPERIWDIPLNIVSDITYSKEPEFPAVRIGIEKPGSFVRHTKKKVNYVRGGAADAELVILGSNSSGTTRAIIVFHVDSHLKAKFVAKTMTKAILGRSARHHKESIDSLSTTHGRQLGLVLGPLPRQMKGLAGPSHVGGAAVVNRVIADTPASRSGLKEGDVITSCNGMTLDSDHPSVSLKKAVASGAEEIVLQVRRAPGGRKVTCVISFS